MANTYSFRPTATAPAGQAPMRRPPQARAVASYLPALTRKAFEKYGFSAATLLTDWATIVGADLARDTEPERLKWPTGVAARAEPDEDDRGRPGATLILRVGAGRALDIQHRARQLIEHINAYFGYRAVADLRIVQAPLATLSSPRTPPPASPRRPPPAALATIADPSLRSALERMAHGIVMRNSA